MLLTFKTANNKRVIVFSGHTEEEYFEKYGEAFGAEELSVYSPFEVLNGNLDDETKPGQQRKFWTIKTLEGTTLWYEVPDDANE